MASQSSRQDLTGFRKTCQVSSIGRTARDALMERGDAGQVLAVVSNAVYLQTNAGEILWLAREGVPMHTRGGLCSFNEDTLNAGMNFSVRDASLRIGDQCAIDLRRAQLWTPPNIEPARVAPREVVSARVRDLRARLGTTDSLPERARQTTREIARACLERDMARIAKQSQALIGLGAGLTPAGDDFVGGLLFAAFHLKTVYALSWDQHPIDDLLDYARTQTNRISYAVLSDHVRGESIEPLHNWIAALLDNLNHDDITTHARRVLAIGSTTGAEMLAGALMGTLLISKESRNDK